VTIERIEALADGTPFGPPLEGEALAARLRLDRAEGEPATVEGGGGATAFMDVTYGSPRRRPDVLEHRFTLTVRSDGRPDQTLTFTGVPERVRDSTPVELGGAPMRGERWIATNGCCTLNAHRAATLPIDGTTYVPERFAIDFVQLDEELRLFGGPVDQLSSYRYYGTPVRAASAGRVVDVRDDLPEQVPGSLPSDATVQTAGGNHIVTTIGGRSKRYAFYAHLQTGSVRVARGDRVESGEVIGLLGNSGNTDAPHLHFHVMSTPDPLRSNGLPYTFPSFRGQGIVTNIDGIQAGDRASVDPSLTGRHRDVLPVDGQLLDFGG
jgi:hypothetical protein